MYNKENVVGEFRRRKGMNGLDERRIKGKGGDGEKKASSRRKGDELKKDWKRLVDQHVLRHLARSGPPQQPQ
jgi:hypothetical protein